MTGPQPRNHIIDLATAVAMTERHRRQVAPPGGPGAAEGDLGGMFTREAILTLLEQQGARFLRFYYGRNERGGRELILVAADEQGNDLTDITMDGHLPCPPICPVSSELRG
jgi:hypothetical protein